MTACKKPRPWICLGLAGAALVRGHWFRGLAIALPTFGDAHRKDASNWDLELGVNMLDAAGAALQ